MSPKLLQFLYLKNMASELPETFYGIKKYRVRAENERFEVSMVEADPKILQLTPIYKFLSLCANNCPPNASFELIFGLHQDFMIIQRTKHGFWDILIFRPVSDRQSPILGQKLKKWGKIDIQRARTGLKMKISPNPCLALCIIIKSCCKPKISPIEESGGQKNSKNGHFWGILGENGQKLDFNGPARA